MPDQFTVDLRYRLPVPSCDPDVFDTHPVGVAVTRSRTVRRPIDAEGMRFLRRIWQMSCDQLLLRRTVRLEYDGPWRLGPDGVLAGRLRLLRIGGHAGGDPAVTLTEIQGSPVFDLALGRPRTLAAGVRSVDVPLLVRSGSRCDAHSRGQVTTPFTFRVWARIGGRSVTVIAMPAERTKVRMLAFLDRMCAQ